MPTSSSNSRFCSLLLLILGLLFFKEPTAYAISGGQNAHRLLGQVQVSAGTGLCTGSLIGPTWVLTAAHCVDGENPGSVTVNAGSFAIDQGEIRHVSRIVKHPNYQGANNPYYDAALLQLTTAVVTVDPMPYGTGQPGRTKSGAPVPAVLTVQGWGATQGGGPAAVLQTSTQLVSQQYSSTVVLVITPTLPIPGVLQRGDSGAGYIYRMVVCGVHSGGATLGGPDAKEGAATDALAPWIEANSGVQPAPNFPDGTKPCEAPEAADEAPADTYNDAGQVSVGCFSTVRALFRRVFGTRLYQVQRSSDGTTQDIGSTSPGGYANAASQDSFCANASCIITKIYDQSPFGNDLTIEGAGGAKGTPDLGAVANALPITIDGHKAYGVSVTPGVGYRNNTTIGVARNVGPPPVNKTPEGMYMMTSGRNFNGACCFDFGNAETNTRDNGNGHMDTINFGSFCGFPPCNGSGPWVQADLENGQYMGGGSNPSNPRNVSFPQNFVVATLKNDSQNIFALKGGDGQTGAAVDLYNGSLPTQKSGYVPMQLEGAIVLGTGGDNSAGGIGSFFEGVIVNGYPSDATEYAVINKVAAAKYSGNSVPTNGEPPSYTGPSDPNGPGPQDGFEMPSDIQSPDLMGSKPAMAYFHDTGKIYVAFQANDTSHKLFVTSTVNGTPYPAAINSSGIHIGGAPTMAEFRHQLFIAFQADDSSHQLFITSSPTGANFPTATAYPNILVGSSPAMTEFRHQLFIAFQANDAGHTLHITASTDGRSFPPAAQVPNVQMGSAPAIAAFRSQLFVAFRANDPSNDLWIASSVDGYHFNSYRIPGPNNTQTMGLNSSPALVVSNNILYCIYGAPTQANEMLVMSSTDGVTWQGPKAYLNDKMGATGPGATAIPVGITVGFQSNDSRNVLFTSHKATEGTSYDGANYSGGPQDGFSSVAIEQANDLMGSRPAFAYSLNDVISTAFQANDASHKLFFASTTFGQNYPPATGYPNIHIGSAPTMINAALGGNTAAYYIAFQADDGTNELFVTSSKDGTNFPAAHLVPNVHMGGAPSLTYFNNKLYLAFQADDPGHALFITNSSNGTDWTPSVKVPNVQIGSDPSIAVHNGKIYVAFRADDPSDDAWIASSSDGVNFTSQRLSGQVGGESAPALVESGGTLYYICEANDLGHEMLVYASTDGARWQGPEVYPGVQMSASGPGAGPYFVNKNTGHGVTLGFQSNDTRDVLFTVIKDTASH